MDVVLDLVLIDLNARLIHGLDQIIGGGVGIEVYDLPFLQILKARLDLLIGLSDDGPGNLEHGLCECGLIIQTVGQQLIVCVL